MVIRTESGYYNNSSYKLEVISVFTFYHRTFVLLLNTIQMTYQRARAMIGHLKNLIWKAQ